MVFVVDMVLGRLVQITKVESRVLEKSTNEQPIFTYLLPEYFSKFRTVHLEWFEGPKRPGEAECGSWMLQEAKYRGTPPL